MSILRFGAVALLTVGVLALCGCAAFGIVPLAGNNDIKTVEKNLPADLGRIRVEHLNLFPGINKSVAFVMHESDTPKVVVSADSNILSDMTVSVANNELIVSGKRGRAYNTANIRVDVYGKGYKDLTLGLSSNIDFSTDGTLSADKLSFNASGMVAGGGDIAVSDARFVISGSGDLAMTGTAKSLDFVVSGSGKIDSSAINCEDVGVTISGSGTANMTASKSVKCSVSGSGTLIVAGTADLLDVSISGSGKVEAPTLAAKTAKLLITGSGRGNVTVSDELDITITGSGHITYSGRPHIKQRVSGSGTIENIG